MSGYRTINITATGALIVKGGVGIEQNLYLGGTMTIHSTELSTSTSTGALKVLGGVGIQENLNLGGTLTTNKTIIIKDTTKNVNTNIKLYSSQSTDYTLTLPIKSGQVACLSDVIPETYLIPIAHSSTTVNSVINPQQMRILVQV